MSNRSAIGARAIVTSGSVSQSREVRGGGSYLSQHAFRLHFGLGRSGSAEVEVHWPSGLQQRLGRLKAGRVHAIVEPESGS